MKIFVNLLICILWCTLFSSCITSDTPPIEPNNVKVVHVYNQHYPFLPPKRPLYIWSRPRDPYKPVWQQRPDVRPRHDGFGNMNRKPIDRPRNIINPRNKNFGGRR